MPRSLDMENCCLYTGEWHSQIWIESDLDLRKVPVVSVEGMKQRRYVWCQLSR